VKIVLKVAVQDIGQLTDFDWAGRSPPSGRDDDLGGDQRSRFRYDDRGYSPAATLVNALPGQQVKERPDCRDGRNGAAGYREEDADSEGEGHSERITERILLRHSADAERDETGIPADGQRAKTQDRDARDDPQCQRL
jgi:hypothetical protein